MARCSRPIFIRLSQGLRVAALCLLVGVGSRSVRAEEFLSVLDDMPLAPGLTEIADQAADFDTPAGRIIDAAARGEAEPGTIDAFYDKTLPALGWVREGAGRFVRDRERLTITIVPAVDRRSVMARFSLRPRGGE